MILEILACQEMEQVGIILVLILFNFNALCRTVSDTEH